MTSRGTQLVRLEGISKAFYGALANDGVDLALSEGEIHAVLGENGAGKTTLCSVLSGMYRPDAGRIVIAGHQQEFRSPADALAAGVGMVYQHFKLVPTFTVAENIALGQPQTPRLLSRSELERTAAELMERYEISVPPGAVTSSLTVGEQQRVEILKLLHRGVRVLILDEPTAVLTPNETEVLFRAMKALAADGRAIVFVSHKLNEVLAVSSTVTVLRDGKVVATVDTAAADERMLARLMVERADDAETEVAVESHQPVRPTPATAADGPVACCLEVCDLEVADDRGHVAVRGLSVHVNRGEIVGVVGVAGNGQRELAEAIAGIRQAVGGSVTINGDDVTRTTVRARVERGLAFIPEDRMSMGVAAGLAIEDNLLLRSYWRAPAAGRGLLHRNRMRPIGRELVERYGVRGVRPGFPIRILSGGNVQRVILARELAGSPAVIVAASPCRGLDVHAAAAVRTVLADQRDQGCGVLLISEDLDELLALSDRLVVIYEGAVTAELDPRTATPEQLGLLMAGVAA